MKALLINDTENIYHWGCYGTSHALKSKLSQLGVDITYTFSCDDGSKLENAPKGCLGVYSKNMFTRLVSRVYYTSYFKNKASELISNIKKCDCVVINGEGTINSIHIGTRFIFFIIYLAKDVFNKKVYLINHSCYPKINNNKQIRYYREAYSRCDFISAREPKSKEIIEVILGMDAELSFDSLPLAVSEVINEVPNNILNKKYICISGAVNYKKENSEFISKEIKNRYPEHKIIYLVGSISGMNNEEPRVIKSLMAYMPDMVVYDAKKFELWLSIIKHADVLICGRYHYAIAAMCFGTPMVCFSSNTPKIDAVNRWFDLPNCINTHAEYIKSLNNINKFPWKSYLTEMCKLAEVNYEFVQER